MAVAVAAKAAVQRKVFTEAEFVNLATAAYVQQAAEAEKSKNDIG